MQDNLILEVDIYYYNMFALRLSDGFGTWLQATTMINVCDCCNLSPELQAFL